MNLFVTQTRVVEVPVTTLSVAATCQQAMLIDAAGQCVGSTSDMPAFMPTLLEIDLATGAIKNWNVPTVAQLQAIADGQSAAVAPTPLTELRMAELMLQSKHVEIEPFKPSEVVPDTVAILEKYAPQMPSLVDESQMPYGYFDDERDPALLNAEPTLGSTCAPPQAVESAADTVANAADCAPAGQQSNPLEIDGIKTPNHGWVAGLLVSVSEKAGKWSATTGQHTATSTQGKFEAINGALYKAGMGRCEINQQKDENGHPIDGMYLADDSRTKGLTPVYVSGHEIGKGHTARTSSGKKYTAPTEAEALDGLLREVLKVEVPDDAIVDTTDDEMVFNDKQRFIINMTKAVAIVEPVAEAEPVAAEHAPVEPVADPDDIKPVCTLKQKLEPLPAITDNGDLPSDFDGGDSDSAAVIEVAIYKRDSGEYAATTGAGATYVRASSKYSASDALKNLLKKCSLTVADSAIVETTTDDDVAQNRTRYSIDTSFAEQPSDSDLANDEIAYSGDTELPEPVAANPDQIDIEQAIAEALVRPEPVMDLSQPAPVDIVTELDLRPFNVLNQLIAVQQRQCDPIYSAFFAARGITEGGKLSSKGTRLLAGLSQAESNERAEQIVKNACDVPETDATYDEIVALINHAPTQMQVLKLTDRISKHGNFAERQKLFFIQKDRIEALKADSAA